MVNNRCDKNGVHGQLTPQAPLNHSGVCPRVGVGQSPAVVVVLGVGVGQSTPHLFTSSLPWSGWAWFRTMVRTSACKAAVGVCVGSNPLADS